MALKLNILLPPFCCHGSPRSCGRKPVVLRLFWWQQNEGSRMALNLNIRHALTRISHARFCRRAPESLGPGCEAGSNFRVPSLEKLNFAAEGQRGGGAKYDPSASQPLGPSAVKIECQKAKLFGRGKEAESAENQGINLCVLCSSASSNNSASSGAVLTGKKMGGKKNAIRDPIFLPPIFLPPACC